MILSYGPKFAGYPSKSEIPIDNLMADIEPIIASFKNKEDNNVIRGK